MVEHCCVKFGDPSCIGFRDVAPKKIQTDAAENIIPATIVGVANQSTKQIPIY